MTFTFYSKFQKASFRTQLTLLVLTGLIVVVITTSISSSLMVRQTIRKDFINQGSVISEAFANQSVLSLIYESQQSAKEAVNMVRSFEHITKAAIYKKTGELLYEDNNSVSWLDNVSDEVNTVYYYENPRFIEFVAPVVLSGSEESQLDDLEQTDEVEEYLGFARVLLSKHELNNIIKNMVLTNLVVAILLSGILFMALIALVKRLSEPVHELAATMHRAEESERGLRVNLSGSNEIISMSKAFNTMMMGLEERESSLKKEINDRKKAEGMLRESEEKFRTLTTISPVGVFYSDTDGNYVYGNRLWHETTGITKEEVMENSWINIIYEEDREQVREAWQRAVAGKKSFKSEFRFQKEDNNFTWVLGEATPERNAEHVIKGYVGTFTDITKLREAEEMVREHQLELAHVSRLKTVGEMVSGIAHELNQPLTAIVNYTGGCVKRLEKENVSADIIDVMHRANVQAERAGKIIHGFKDFLRKGQVNVTPIQPNELIEDVVQLIKCESNQGFVDIVLKLGDDLPDIMVDKIQIEQVLINIIHNGIEAMNSVDTDVKKLTIETVRSDKHTVKVLITDTGPGISDEIIHKIFDPFFTTKSTGMGMGLAICHSIVENQHGKLEVKSEYGEGTQFSVMLPTNGG